MKTVDWIYAGASFAKSEVYTVRVHPLPCIFCGAHAVTELPPPVLARQPDATNAVCNPATGGCNHGFAVDWAREEQLEARGEGP